MRACRPRFIFLFGFLFALFGLASAQAHLAVFKDGYAVTGHLLRPGGWAVDSGSGQSYWMAKGMFRLDADARRIFFAHRQLLAIDESSSTEDADLVRLQGIVAHVARQPIFPFEQIIGATPWDAKWERIYKVTYNVNDTPGRANLRQRLTLLTPRFARVDGVNHNWSSYYLTSELGVDTVRSLLSTHPDTKPTKEPDPARRFRIYRFLAQAGWYDAAAEELTAIANDMPDEKEKVEEARQQLAKACAAHRVEEIELARQAGRHGWAQKELQTFKRNGLDERLVSRVRTIGAYYETASEKLATAQGLLKGLPRPAESDAADLYKEAIPVIIKELTLENADRLDAFVDAARSAEGQRKTKKTPDASPAELLALAVSGWVIGSPSADKQLHSAHNLWRARRFVLDYQGTDDASQRRRLLKAYQAKTSETVAFDELTQLIGFLPPVQADADLTTTKPMELKIEPSGSKARPISYLVQLPPEYTHYRHYPVLFALHAARRKPLEMIEELAPLAAEHGYILVAPEWEIPLEDHYLFSVQEHAAVIETLREVRRRFQVDSDRVFLLGVEEGGNMAYDVGLSHPDLFAGLLPMSAQPRYFAGRYWSNAQYLPVYVTLGDNIGDDAGKRNRGPFERWIPLGFPALCVEYKGRSVEWFAGELPFMFDWMDHKRDNYKRSFPLPDLGKPGSGTLAQEFQTLRPTDNHFYWLSTDSISPRNVNDPRNWRNQILSATLQAHVFEGNQIAINTRGLREVSLWLGRRMIDFTKPLTVRVNGASAWLNRKVTPDLATLLEDLYLHGDRQRLFWARLDFDRL